MKSKIKIISLFLVFALLFNIFAPTFKVIAANPPTNNYAIVQINGATSVENKNNSNSITASFENGIVTFTGTGLYSNGNSIYVPAGGNVSVSATGNQNYTGKLTIGGTDKGTSAELNSLAANSVTIVDAEFTEEAATYGNITFNVTFTNTEGEVSINNGAGRTTEGPSYNGTLQGVGYTDSSKTNKIIISTSFGFHVASSIEINGVQKDVNNAEINEYDVAGADTYTIKVVGDTTSTTRKTVIWANTDDIAGHDGYMDDMVLSNGSAKAIAVYDANGNKLDSTVYTNGESDQYGLKDGLGWITAKEGETVVFEFVPKYGYQLTSVKANGVPLAPQDTTNQYSFVMGNANIHFSAEFTATEDVVKAESEKVSSGTIDLGNSLEGGSVQLTVKDVELSSDKIKGFEDAAGQYKIANYLDIDLYNVFYKGKTDGEDVWSNKIDELPNEATISIKLADGVNGDDIVLVHNIHDGEEYEIIEIESYDRETNTITFKTKSFSNYAIASKDSVKSTKGNPSTGDNIIIFATMFVVSIAGLFTTTRFNKSLKSGRH
ncbi:MAG: hypothetical protein IKG42_02570 [Clostridia bacterium]|nr:hypothetical protein [Clostridia bacterium]